MSGTSYKLGVISYNKDIRQEIDIIGQSPFVRSVLLFEHPAVKSVYVMSGKFKVIDNKDMVFDDPDIEVVVFLVPPDKLAPLLKKAVSAGKHIVVFNPITKDAEAAAELRDMLNKQKNYAAVLHKGTDEIVNHQLKRIFSDEKLGALVIYKIDKFCKPFYGDDAQQNNRYLNELLLYYLDKSRYLIDGDILSYNFYSQGKGQDKKNQEADFLKVNFDNGASAHIFITWTNNVEMYNGYGAEVMGASYLITEKGWYITIERENGNKKIKAYKGKQLKEWVIDAPVFSALDVFLKGIESGEVERYSINRAMENMEIIRKAENIEEN
jgi:predicted dehydrogenase